MIAEVFKLPHLVTAGVSHRRQQEFVMYAVILVHEIRYVHDEFAADIEDVAPREVEALKGAVADVLHGPMIERSAFHVRGDMDVVRLLFAHPADELMELALQDDVVLHQQVMVVAVLLCIFNQGDECVGQQFVALMEEAPQFLRFEEEEGVVGIVLLPDGMGRLVVEDDEVHCALYLFLEIGQIAQYAFVQLVGGEHHAVLVLPRGSLKLFSHNCYFIG